MFMTPFPFELVSPERILTSGEVDAVVLPASEGDITILSGHAPLMTTLKTGFLVVTEKRDNGRRILVRGGFAEIGPKGLTVLAERAIPAGELTLESLDAEITHAEMLRDAAEGHAARVQADATIAQLQEAKAALKY
jgi:F-type H+-transporting ATPase subunit epsilon